MAGSDSFERESEPPIRALRDQFALKCELKELAQQNFELQWVSVEFVQIYDLVHTHKLPAG